MRVLAVSALALLATGCPSEDDCGDVNQWYTEPAELTVAGGYAFAGVHWNAADAGCFGSSTRVHAIELGATLAPRASKKISGSLLGESVAAGSRVYFASGADEELFAIDSTPPFDVDRIALPGVPSRGAAAGGRAFFPLFFADAVWMQPDSGDGSEIAVPQPLDAVASGGLVYVSSAAGNVAEIDPATGTVLRSIPSCAAAGPITTSSGGRLVLACDGGGAGVLDIASGTFSTVGGALSVAEISGASAGVLWSIDGTTDRYTQVLDPASGGDGEQLLGWLADDAVFAGANAFASLDGTPWRIALSGSGSTALTGFGTEAGARMAAGDPGEVLVLEGGAGEGALLHRLDATTGAAIDAPILLPAP